MDIKKTMIVALAFAAFFSLNSFADTSGQQDDQEDQGPIQEQGPPPRVIERPPLPQVYQAPQPPPPPCEAFYYGGPYFQKAPVPGYCPILQYTAPNQFAVIPCESFFPEGFLSVYPAPLPGYCGAFGPPGFPAPVPVVVQPVVPYYGGPGVVVQPGFGRGFGGNGYEQRGFAGRGFENRGGNFAVTPHAGNFVGGPQHFGNGGGLRHHMSVENGCSVEKSAGGEWVVKNAIGAVKFKSDLRNNDGEAAAKKQKLQLEKTNECKLPGSNKALDI